MEHLKKKIRTLTDFPSPGIQFKDITPLLADAEAFAQVINHLKSRHQANQIDLVAGIDARGFIFAAALAYALSAGTTLIRKSGKLPYQTHELTYDLEYGTDTIAMHTDAIQPGQRILLIDDVLATGGTAAAAQQLIQTRFAGELVEINFLMELSALNGRTALSGSPIYSVLTY